MECLEGYIGIQGCNTSAPESGVYVNSLPGISIEVLQKVTDSEQVTFINAWNDITARALRRFKTDVINNLKKRFRLNIISKFINTGKAVDTSTITQAAANWRGRIIQIMGETPSELNKAYIEEVNIYFQAAGATTLKILDENGFLLVNKTVTATSVGWKRTYIGDTYNGKTFYVLYDATNINSVKTVNTPELDTSCDCYCSDIYDDCDCSIRTNGVIGTDINDIETFTENLNSYGLSIVFGLRCAYDAIICANRTEFIEPLQYLHGVEFLAERIYSTRVNRYTTVDLAKAKEMRTEFEAIYQASLQAILDGIRISQYDCCIECEWVTNYDQCTP